MLAHQQVYTAKGGNVNPQSMRATKELADSDETFDATLSFFLPLNQFTGDNIFLVVFGVYRIQCASTVLYLLFNISVPICRCTGTIV